MPKNFNDERQLPYRITRLDVANIDEATLQRLFASANQLSINLVFAGFDSSCLGYVVNAKKVGDTFEISNIAGELELRVLDMRSLAELLKHVCGVSYSSGVQDAFQRVRNDIGSAGKVTSFGATS